MKGGLLYMVALWDRFGSGTTFGHVFDDCYLHVHWDSIKQLVLHIKFKEQVHRLTSSKDRVSIGHSIRRKVSETSRFRYIETPYYACIVLAPHKQKLFLPHILACTLLQKYQSKNRKPNRFQYPKITGKIKQKKTEGCLRTSHSKFSTCLDYL